MFLIANITIFTNISRYISLLITYILILAKVSKIQGENENYRRIPKNGSKSNTASAIMSLWAVIDNKFQPVYIGNWDSSLPGRVTTLYFYGYFVTLGGMVRYNILEQQTKE